MASQKQIKKRVGSIKNIGKITSALEMVAASRVQRAQDIALRAKPYADKVYELVTAVASQKVQVNLPLMRKPLEINKDLYIIISTNKGLAGSLNTNLFGALQRQLDANISHKFVTVGIKGRNFALRHGELLADFSDTEPFSANIPAVIEITRKAFESNEADKVYLVYSGFKTVMTQESVIKELLPIAKTTEPQELTGASYTFEPSIEEVLENLMVFYLENQVRDAIHEAEASEHAARMIAMKNASDNAKELASALVLEYNKARQSAVTAEIADVVTSTESLSK